MLKSAILFWLLTSLCVTQDIDAILPNSDSSKEYLAEAVNAHKVQLGTWHSGDFLLELKSSVEGSPKDSDDLLVESTTERWRYIFDSEKGKYVFIHATALTSEVIFSDDSRIESSGERVAEYLEGFVVNEDGSFGRSLPNNPLRLREGLKVNDLLASFGVPELRGTGFTVAGAYAEIKVIDELLDLYSSTDRLESASTNSGSLHGKFQFKSPSNGVESFVKLEFDQEGFFPLSRIVQIRSKSSGSLVTNSEETYQWIQVNDIFVPSVLDVFSKNIRRFDKETFYVDDNKRFRVHWFSVNSDIDDEVFDSTLLGDAGKMHAMVDPIKTNAETLIPPKIKKHNKSDPSEN